MQGFCENMKFRRKRTFSVLGDLPQDKAQCAEQNKRGLAIFFLFTCSVLLSMTNLIEHSRKNIVRGLGVSAGYDSPHRAGVDCKNSYGKHGSWKCQ